MYPCRLPTPNVSCYPSDANKAAVHHRHHSSGFPPPAGGVSSGPRSTTSACIEITTTCLAARSSLCRIANPLTTLHRLAPGAQIASVRDPSGESDHEGRDRAWPRDLTPSLTLPVQPRWRRALASSSTSPPLPKPPCWHWRLACGRNRTEASRPGPLAASVSDEENWSLPSVSVSARLHVPGLRSPPDGQRALMPARRSLPAPETGGLKSSSTVLSMPHIVLFAVGLRGIYRIAMYFRGRQDFRFPCSSSACLPHPACVSWFSPSTSQGPVPRIWPPMHACTYIVRPHAWSGSPQRVVNLLVLEKPE